MKISTAEELAAITIGLAETQAIGISPEDPAYIDSLLSNIANSGLAMARTHVQERNRLRAEAAQPRPGDSETRLDFTQMEQELSNLDSNQPITTEQAQRIREQIESMDTTSLNDDQRNQLKSLLKELDTSSLTISSRAELAYAEGKLVGYADQVLRQYVDREITKKFRESGDNPQVVQDHVNDLQTKIKTQVEEVQKLQQQGASDQVLAEALGKLHRLNLEQSAIIESEAIGRYAKLNENAVNLDTYQTARVYENLTNLSGNARLEAEGFISDLSLSAEDIQTRENTIGEIDFICNEILEGRLQHSDDLDQKIKGFVDSLDPNHLNPAKKAQVDSLVAIINSQLVRQNSASERRNTPTNTEVDTSQDTEARTVLEVDRKTGERVATLSYDSEASKNNQRISTEENLHARENIIDPGTIDPETGKAPMDLAEYQARRALREAVAQQAADAKVASEKGGSVSEAKTSHSQKIKDINAAIKNGDFDRAISLAQEAQYIDDQYLGQYKADYDYNTNPDNPTLRQTSFSAVDVDEYNQLAANLTTREQIADLKTMIDDDVNLTEAERVDLANTIVRTEQRIIRDEENQRILRMGLDSTLERLAKNATTNPQHLELRRILLDESTSGEDSILKTALLSTDTRIREFAYDAIGFDPINRAAATKLLKDGHTKTIQVLNLTDELNKLPSRIGIKPLDFRASARIHEQLSYLGIIPNSSNMELIKAFIGEQYPEASVITAIESKIRARNPNWSDIQGPIHEMRAYIALERMVANGIIKSFVVAENVVNKYKQPKGMTKNPKQYIGIDALGIDVLIVMNNGNIVPCQIKSSDTGINHNYSDRPTYITTRGDKININRRWNNPFDATNKSLTEMAQALLYPSKNNRSVRFPPEPTTGNYSIDDQVVIDCNAFGELKHETGDKIESLNNETQMEILEDAIILDSVVYGTENDSW